MSLQVNSYWWLDGKSRPTISWWQVFEYFPINLQNVDLRSIWTSNLTSRIVSSFHSDSIFKSEQTAYQVSLSYYRCCHHCCCHRLRCWHTRWIFGDPPWEWIVATHVISLLCHGKGCWFIGSSYTYMKVWWNKAGGATKTCLRLVVGMFSDALESPQLSLNPIARSMITSCFSDWHHASTMQVLHMSFWVTDVSLGPSDIP